MFLPPFLVFLTIGIITGQNFAIPWVQLFEIACIAIVFGYLGNLFSVIGIERAPNPGYSLIISKSYVVFTTIIAILLFNAELSLRKFGAIIIIVVFSALIMLPSKKTQKKNQRSWINYSMGAFVCWGMLSISSKYIFNQGVNIFVFLTYSFFFASICIIIESLRKKMKLSAHLKYPWIFLMIAVAQSSFNFFNFNAIRTASNIGYVNAINVASIAVVAILAIAFFKDEFSKRKMIGVVGVTLGLLLLVI